MGGPAAQGDIDNIPIYTTYVCVFVAASIAIISKAVHACPTWKLNNSK